jgi:hypothetical protein
METSAKIRTIELYATSADEFDDGLVSRLVSRFIECGYVPKHNLPKNLRSIPPRITLHFIDGCLVNDPNK